MTDSSIGNLLYLLGCSLNGSMPKVEFIERMDLDGVLALAQEHSVSAMAAMALAQAQKLSDRWSHEIAVSEYRYAMMELQREKVLAGLSEAGIRYVCLKGIVMAGLYPSPTMREMCDNDILYDYTPEHQRTLLRIMENLGFKATSVDAWSHDAFEKEPIFNFEMHRKLFSDAEMPQMAQYFSDIWRRVLPAEGSSCEYVMTNADFYLHFISHAYKHYLNGGFGLRTLCDFYVLNSAPRDDSQRVAAGLDAFGAAQFAETFSGLAQLLLAEPERVWERIETLDAKQRNALGYMMRSGTYGTYEHVVANQVNLLEGQGTSLGAVRARYLMQRLFPSPKWMEEKYPALAKNPWALPFFYAYRVVRGATVRCKNTNAEIRALDDELSKRAR